MEYQKKKKKKKLLDNTPNHLTKFRTKNWIEVNSQEDCIVPIVTLDSKLQC